MFFSPALGLRLQAIDVFVELFAVNAPHAPPSDLDRRKVARPNERVDLRDADRQIGGHVLEREQARLESRSGGAPPTLLRTLAGRHGRTIAPGDRENLDLSSFARVCSRPNAEALI